MQRLAPIVGDLLDLEPLAVEDDLGRAFLGLDVERRCTRHPLGGEVRVEVERDMGHPGDFGPGEGLVVAGVVAGEDGRDLALAIRLRLLLVGCPGGAGGEQGEGGKEQMAHGSLQSSARARPKGLSGGRFQVTKMADLESAIR